MNEADITRMKEQQALRALETLDRTLGGHSMLAVRLDGSWRIRITPSATFGWDASGSTLLEAFAQLAQTLEAR